MRSCRRGCSIEFIRSTRGKARMYIRAIAKAKNDTMGCAFIHSNNFTVTSPFGFAA
jgi:hypothetical protein